MRVYATDVIALLCDLFHDTTNGVESASHLVMVYIFHHPI